MTSGVAVDEQCRTMWQDFHSAKVKTRRVVTFRVNDKFNLIIPDSDEWQLPMTHINNEDAVEETKETMKNLKKIIADEVNDDNKPNLPRWIIFYFEYMTTEGRLTGKECLIKWCPEGVKVKSRMTFASSSKGFTDALENFKALVIQCDELEELDEIVPRFEKGLLK